MALQIVIYKATSPSGKAYIGQTSNLKRRWQAHCHPNSKCPVLRDAIQKYGAASFKVEVLSCVDADLANAAEMAAIRDHKTVCPNGYNILHGGDLERADMVGYPGYTKQVPLPGYIYECGGRRGIGYEVRKPGMPRRSFTHSASTQEERLAAAKEYLEQGEVAWQERGLPPNVYKVPGKITEGYAVQRKGCKRKSFTSSTMTMEQKFDAACKFAQTLGEPFQKSRSEARVKGEYPKAKNIE